MVNFASNFRGLIFSSFYIKVGLCQILCISLYVGIQSSGSFHDSHLHIFEQGKGHKPLSVIYLGMSRFTALYLTDIRGHFSKIR